VEEFKKTDILVQSCDAFGIRKFMS
jgi:hypothetical protein